MRKKRINVCVIRTCVGYVIFFASNKKSILFCMTSWDFLLFLFFRSFLLFDTLYVMFVTQASFPLVCSLYKLCVCSANLIQNAFYYVEYYAAYILILL